MSLLAAGGIAFDLKWAQTLDGQLCDDSGTSQWITGEAELRKTHEIRRQCDAVMVGAGTFLADLCQLTVRMVPLEDGELQPVRIIVDGRGSVAEKAQMDPKVREALEKGSRPTLILTPRAPKIEIQNTHFIECDLDFDLSAETFRQHLLQAMAEGSRRTGRTFRRVLVEGGPRLLTQFLTHGLHDRVFVSIAPILTGGRKHRIFLDRPLSAKMRFATQESAALGEDRFLSLKEILS